MRFRTDKNQRRNSLQLNVVKKKDVVDVIDAHAVNAAVYKEASPLESTLSTVTLHGLIKLFSLEFVVSLSLHVQFLQNPYT